MTRALRAWRRVDGAVYAVEAGIVTAATALMALFILFSIVFEFSHGQVLAFRRAAQAGGVTFATWLPTLFVLFASIAIFYAGASSSPALRSTGRPFRAAAALAGTTFAGAVVWVMNVAHPRVTCLLATAAGGAYAARWILRQARDGKAARRWVVWGISVGGAIWLSFGVSERFSAWTHSYALFLLLWMGFIGASMATSSGRHLRIDAVRKAVPRRHLARYNAVSFAVCALFSGVFFYLAVRYTLARFGQETTAGEIPDWARVLAIPVSLFFVTVRFAARSTLAAMGHIEEIADEAGDAISEAEAEADVVEAGAAKEARS